MALTCTKGRVSAMSMDSCRHICPRSHERYTHQVGIDNPCFHLTYRNCGFCAPCVEVEELKNSQRIAADHPRLFPEPAEVQK